MDVNTGSVVGPTDDMWMISTLSEVQKIRVILRRSENTFTMVVYQK